MFDELEVRTIKAASPAMVSLICNGATIAAVVAFIIAAIGQ